MAAVDLRTFWNALIVVPAVAALLLRVTFNSHNIEVGLSIPHTWIGAPVRIGGNVSSPISWVVDRVAARWKIHPEDAPNILQTLHPRPIPIERPCGNDGSRMCYLR